MTFWEFAQTQGCKLLKDDVKFIRECLKKIPKGRHRILLRGYIDKWQQGMASCENPVAKENTGRREANWYLLGEVNETSRNC